HRFSLPVGAGWRRRTRRPPTRGRRPRLPTVRGRRPRWPTAVGRRRPAPPGVGSVATPKQLALDFLDRLRDRDATRARLGAVVRRAAAPQAVHAVQYLQTSVGALVARVEDEAVRVHDGGRT